MDTPILTSAGFRRALAQFATGVTVVTAEREPGQAYGMTANSFTSVSLEPLLILVCVDERSRILSLIHKNRRFGVSVLTADQRGLSEYFAQSEQTAEEERRLGIAFRWTESGVPLLERTLAQLACKLVAEYVSGDHTIFVGEVVSADVQPGHPLLFWGGEYHRIAP